MAELTPQADLRRGLSGGADVWDSPTAGPILSEDYFAAASGGGSVTVTFNVTDANDVLSADVGVAVVAEATLADGADTVASTADVRVLADASLADGTDTLASTADVWIEADATLADADDTLVGTADVGVGVDANVGDGPDTLGTTALVLVTAQADLADGDDTLQATATTEEEPEPPVVTDSGFPGVGRGRRDYDRSVTVIRGRTVPPAALGFPDVSAGSQRGYDDEEDEALLLMCL